MNRASEYREHLGTPARPIFPATADGLCHGIITVKYEAWDSYRRRTVVISECRLCHRCFVDSEVRQ